MTDERGGCENPVDPAAMIECLVGMDQGMSWPSQFLVGSDYRDLSSMVIQSLADR